MFDVTKTGDTVEIEMDVSAARKISQCVNEVPNGIKLEPWKLETRSLGHLPTRLGRRRRAAACHGSVKAGLTLQRLRVWNGGF